jgi:hypothetical protein
MCKKEKLNLCGSKLGEFSRTQSQENINLFKKMGVSQVPVMCILQSKPEE